MLEPFGLEAISSRLEAAASRLEAIASRLESIALMLEAIASRLEAICFTVVPSSLVLSALILVRCSHDLQGPNPSGPNQPVFQDQKRPGLFLHVFSVPRGLCRLLPCPA